MVELVNTKKNARERSERAIFYKKTPHTIIKSYIITIITKTATFKKKIWKKSRKYPGSETSFRFLETSFRFLSLDTS